MSKRHRVLRRLAADALLTAIALCVFALFHHVLPRAQQSVGIVISNPYKTETPRGGNVIEQPEGAIMIASAYDGTSASDVSGFYVSGARGRNNKNNSKNNGSNNKNNGRGGQTGTSGKGGSALTEDSALALPEAEQTADLSPHRGKVCGQIHRYGSQDGQ